MTPDRKRQRRFNTARPLAAASARVKSLSVALNQAAIRVSVHDEVMTSRSQIFRLKAFVCEQRARETADPASKENWQELAIEWHTIASATAKIDDDAPQVQLS
jgi:hypothetical protein